MSLVRNLLSLTTGTLVVALGFGIAAPQAQADEYGAYEINNVIEGRIDSEDDVDTITVYAIEGERISVLVMSNEIDPYALMTDEGLVREVSTFQQGMVFSDVYNDDQTASVHSVPSYLLPDGQEANIPVSTNATFITEPVAETGYYTLEIGSSLGGYYQNSDELYSDINPGGWMPSPTRTTSGSYTAIIDLIAE